MQYETRKNILSITIAGTLVIFPVLALAGTGPNTNSWSEEFYVTIDWIGSTSSQIIYHFPASSTAPDQQYFVNYPVACWSTFNTSTITQDINGYWPYLGDVILANTCTGNWTVSSSAIIPVTSGTVAFRFYPQETTAPTLNVAITSTPAHEVGYTPTSTRGSNWTTAYYDFDFLDLGSGSSTEMYLQITYPDSPSGTMSSPLIFVAEAINAIEENFEYRFVYDLYGVNSSSPALFTWYDQWFQASSTYNYGNIFSVPLDLYQRSSSVPYNLKVILQKRNLYSFTQTDLLYDWSSFTVDSPQNTSSIITRYKPKPTSSADRAQSYQDCGDWYQFQLGCHFENSMTWLFVPSWTMPGSDEVSPFADLWLEYQNVFPFSIFSTVKVYMVDELTMTRENLEPLYLNLNIAGQTSSIKIASPDYFEDIFGTPLTNLFFNIVITFASIAMLTMMFKKTASLI